MTETISRSLAVSLVTHAVVIVTAGLLLSSISKIEIPPVPATAFVLVGSETTQPSSLINANDATATVSLPPIPRPAISQTESPPPSTARSPLPPPRPASSAVRTSSISFADFQASHAKKPEPTARTNATPVIAPGFEETNTPTAGSRTAISRVDISDAEALRAFNAGLIQKLREAYQAAGSEGGGYQCRIEFVLSEQGRVSSSRIVRSSGNRAFDEAVIQALGRVRVTAPPKLFIETPLATTFRVEH